jgi:hypothetical protein
MLIVLALLIFTSYVHAYDNFYGVNYFGLNSQAPYEYSGSSEVRPGYSSSFLSFRDGELFTKSYRVHVHPLLKSKSAQSLMDKFEEARFRIIQKAPFDQELLPLKEVFKSMALDREAYDWEGFCHRWSAASSDSIVGPLASQKGLVCKDIQFTRGELQELFSLTYYAEESKASYGGRTYDESEDKFVHKLDLKIFSKVGDVNFLPHVFHQVVHETLRGGEGLIMDEDPSGEIWNQPVHKIESNVTKMDGRDFSDEKDIVSEMLIYNFTPNTAAAKQHIEKMKDIIKALKLVLDDTDKTLNSKVSDIFRQYKKSPKSVSKDLYERVIQKEKEFRERKTFESTITPNKDQIPVKILSYVVNDLISLMDEELGKARKEGITLKANFDLYKVKSSVYYLDETNFGLDDRRVDGDEIDSQFITKDTYEYYIVSEERDFEGRRSDFVWIPKAQSKTVKDDYISYYKKIKELRKTQSDEQIVRRMLWLDEEEDENGADDDPNGHIPMTLGLNDLMKLYDLCEPLESIQYKLDLVSANLQYLGEMVSLNADSSKILETPQMQETLGVLKELEVKGIPVKWEYLRWRFHSLGLSEEALKPILNNNI